LRGAWLLALLLLPQGLWAHETPWVRYAHIGGEPVLDVSGDGVDERTPFAVASVGKTMTAVAVLRLVERGDLDLDDPVTTIDHDWPDLDGLDGVTIRHLLTMTSGLGEYYWPDYVEDARDDPDRVQKPEVALTYALPEAAIFAPGTDFDYSNTNYLILGIVLETLSGDSYAEVMAREVFAPAGMLDSFVAGSRALPEGFPRGHAGRSHVRDYYAHQGFGDGGVLASARDLVAFYDALFGSERLLSDAMRAQMLIDPIGEDYGMGIVVSGDWVGHSGGDLGFSSDVVMDRTTGDIAVVLAGEEDADTDWAFSLLSGR